MGVIKFYFILIITAMSYVKRQELFKNVNPLLKKYKYDPEIPP